MACGQEHLLLGSQHPSGGSHYLKIPVPGDPTSSLDLNKAPGTHAGKTWDTHIHTGKTLTCTK